MKSLILVLLISFSGGVSAADWPADSVFHLGSTWTTQDNKKINISELNEPAYMVALIFTSCKGVCPLLISDLKYMSGKLPKEAQKNVKFLLVSIDPATDTPAVLKKYMKKMKLDKRWTLLNGDPADVTELSAALEFQFKESKIEKYTHSSTVYLMNGKGQILAKQAQRMINMDNFLAKAKKIFTK